MIKPNMAHSGSLLPKLAALPPRDTFLTTQGFIELVRVAPTN
jgi:hypothetical protein